VCLSGASVSVTCRCPGNRGRIRHWGQYVQVRLNEETKPQFRYLFASDPKPTVRILDQKVPATNGLLSLKVRQSKFRRSWDLANREPGRSPSTTSHSKRAVVCGWIGLTPSRPPWRAELWVWNRKERGRQTLLRRAHGCGSVCRKFAAWEAQGFEVIPVLSQPDAS
jgi:hypothetical protein